MLISQGVILKDEYVLMVKQYVERGDIVWNFPGGEIENNETPEQAMVREVKEETGYLTKIIELLPCETGKFSFLAEIVSGEMQLDHTFPDNQDIVEIAWISIDDIDKFDAYTLPVRELLLQHLGAGI
ncbi:NUDIX hydrolase [Bacillus sp. SG-1]|uniref:NUDIX hydrolase n=1 Tax=Bacillus sp. SG-1 TaxID=161544 RepID=UPI0001543613|nr:NUDIX hydrolase [Bacillus sp. SG-1]EDL66131.1 MutT/Nudix family protein [Bacillus sp. SG-1]